jgi:MFS family permease
MSRQSDRSVSTKQLKFIYFKNLIVLSLGFMFIFMSYMSLRNIQSSLYKAGGLGIIALSCVYASLFLGCIFATTIVQKLRPKKTIMMCICGMSLYVIANFYPAYYTLIPACALTGFCLANMWTAHATYLANVAARYAVLVDDKIQNILSQFNGIFFAFFQSSQIIGGLISSTVLSPPKEAPGIPLLNATNRTDSEIMSIMMHNSSVDVYVTYRPHCGVKYCSYYEDNLGTADPNSTVDQKMIYILVGVYAACMIVGFLVIALCLDPLDGVMKKSQTCLTKQLTAVFHFFTQWKVACLVGLMFYTMLQSSYMFGEFTKVGSSF